MIPEPDKLFITRKRKKWKFAHFDDWQNCFQLSEVSPKTWVDYFGNERPLTVEIGAGTADLSVGLAGLHADQQYIAVDIKSDRLYTGAKAAQERGLHNIAFVRSHMNEIGKIFAPGTVEELWITFPDPFPRDKQAKHRLTHPSFLAKYQPLLTRDGVIKFKTDNRELFLWSLEQIVATGWIIKELSFDLHESNLSEDYKITTYYERKFMSEGISINYVAFTPTTALMSNK